MKLNKDWVLLCLFFNYYSLVSLPEYYINNFQAIGLS